jgi:hypothetical protein
MASQLRYLLETNWSLNSPGLTDITWLETKFDAASNLPGNLIVACYNPASPTTSESLTTNVLELLEDIVIDIIVPTSAGTAAAINMREAMRQQVYTIVQENYSGIPGSDIWPFREKEKIESPQAVRLTIMVRCRTFLST